MRGLISILIITFLFIVPISAQGELIISYDEIGEIIIKSPVLSESDKDNLILAYITDTDVDIDIAKFYELREQAEKELASINYIIDKYNEAQETLKKGVTGATEENENKDKLEEQQEAEQGQAE